MLTKVELFLHTEGTASQPSSELAKAIAARIAEALAPIDNAGALSGTVSMMTDNGTGAYVARLVSTQHKGEQQQMPINGWRLDKMPRPGRVCARCKERPCTTGDSPLCDDCAAAAILEKYEKDHGAE